MAQFTQAVFSAERVIHENGITDLPVDPFAIAKNGHIEVIPRDPSDNGVSGMLIRVGEDFTIGYSTRINVFAFQRFSVAHELGHYYLPGHVEAVLDASGLHESRAGFSSSNHYELEADHFAAGLLMPRKLFIPKAENAGEGLAAIKSLSAICGTSLIATAIRLNQCTQYPLSIVVSTADKIEYCFMSDPLRDVQGIRWLHKGERLPENSLTREFNQCVSNIQKGLQKDCVLEAKDWFGENLESEMKEEVIGLGKFGKTLTVLHGINIPEDREIDLVD